MNQYQEIYDKVIQTDRYKKNILYGKPRKGHAEGTVEAHIAELEQNLKTISYMISMSDDYFWKLKVLINVHDSFKAESGRNLPILDPNSHASLAMAFLAEYTTDNDILNMVQYHDIGYAVYKKYKEKKRVDHARLDAAVHSIKDLDLFALFCIIDACTPSKGREMITWFIEYLEQHYTLKTVEKRFILPGTTLAEDGAW